MFSEAENLICRHPNSRACCLKKQFSKMSSASISLKASILSRRSLTSLEVASRLLSLAKRFLPASKNYSAQR